jgi:hypothetical protein
MRTLVIIALVVFSVGGAVAGTIGYLIIAFRQDRIARAMAETGLAPLNAVPAPHPQAPARATNPTDPELCMVITCTNPWTVPIHGWKVCAKHDHRAPYDRTIDPELVSEEAEQWLRRSAS